MNPYVIDWIKSRKEESQRPQLELPISDFPIREEKNDVQSSDRGVVTINIFGEDDDEEEA